MSKPRLRIAATGLVAACALATTMALPTAAKDGDVVKTGACSGASDWKLKAGVRDGGIQTEFAVDSNVVGQTWRVRMLDNGAVVLRRTATTVAPSGSFTVRALLANQAGTDKIVARATNLTTGETCAGTVTI